MLSFLATAALLMGSAPPDPLSGYLWRKRVVVVFAARPDDPRVAAQRDAVNAASADGRDRDLVTLEETSPTAAETLRRRFHVSASAFAVVLIGKDGGVKLKAPHVLPAGELEAVIDAMPMRQEEIRRPKRGA